MRHARRMRPARPDDAWISTSPRRRFPTTIPSAPQTTNLVRTRTHLETADNVQTGRSSRGMGPRRVGSMVGRVSTLLATSSAASWMMPAAAWSIAANARTWERSAGSAARTCATFPSQIAPRSRASSSESNADPLRTLVAPRSIAANAPTAVAAETASASPAPVRSRLARAHPPRTARTPTIGVSEASASRSVEDRSPRQGLPPMTSSVARWPWDACASPWVGSRLELVAAMVAKSTRCSPWWRRHPRHETLDGTSLIGQRTCGNHVRSRRKISRASWSRVRTRTPRSLVWAWR